MLLFKIILTGGIFWLIGLKSVHDENIYKAKKLMILSIEAGKLATIRCYTSMVQM
jgi:hypothetical protein